ncbi:MAG: glycosyltransferase [Prevotellaceae bacterium]|jgi:glycosyltransferase involved in cell wall biosynthesis|nr:glycosyltransferase [Prevotellaceae bacterium]
MVKVIGLFSDSYPPILDGVALTVQNYAYWLHRKNQPVSVITVKTPNCADEADYPVYRYFSLPLLFRKPFRMGLPALDRRFQKTVRAIPFKLLHVHSPFSSAEVALHIARQQKVPVVATFHSKYKDDFARATYNKRLAAWMAKRVITFYEKADEVWIPQPAVEETLREYGYKGKVVVMNNGADFTADSNMDEAKRRARAELGIPEALPVFLFIGQHIWEKNTRLVIEALAQLKDVRFKMFFIGTGYAARELQALTHRHGMGADISFLGVIKDRELLKRYYTAADLFLFPSLYDNAPLVVREAAALHTPSVLVRGSTASEIVTDGYNGFLVDNSSGALAARIRALITSPQLIREAGQHAAHTIARPWENVADEVLERYSYIIRNYAATR